MPNHVSNRLTGPAEVLALLIDSKDEYGKKDKCVNFNKLIPCPPEIVTKEFGCHIKSAAELALGLIDFSVGERRASNIADITAKLHLSNCIRQLKDGPHPKDYSDEDFELFVQMMRAYRKHGLMEWYDWNVTNWGTKWGAYSVKFVSKKEITFETAWSPPHPVIEKLATVSGGAFTHEWANEDTGRGVGIRSYSKGTFDERLLDNTKEGYELAFALGAGDAENYELVNGVYRYREEQPC